MRIKTLICLILLLMPMPLQAQDSDYPTMQALANLRVPTFDYADMVNRFSPRKSSHKPPDEPPEYEIGDRKILSLSFDADWDMTRVEMELRGQSRNVLIWVQASVDYPNWRAKALAQQLETKVLDPLQKLYEYAEPPGVDGDPRLYVAMIDSPDADRAGYFDAELARPKSFDPSSDQLEMVVVDLSQDVDYDFYDEILLGIVAHEYLHALQFHADPGEEWWLDEALASYAEFHATKAIFSRSSWHFDSEEFLAAPNTGLTQWFAVEDSLSKYGAGFLFALYLAERFDEKILARLLAEKANGWRSVQNVLREYTDISAEEIFADWVLANYFLDRRRGFGYRALNGELEPPQPIAALNSFPANYTGALPQYSTDYIAIDVLQADKLRLSLRQASEAKLIETSPHKGEFFAYAVTSEESASRLTRAFNLDSNRQIWLEYHIWHDLEVKHEYVYVSISDDNGESWQTLRTQNMRESAVYADYFTHGYTGKVRFWRHERIDLSDYAPGVVLIRFEIVSDYGTLYRGAAIDEVRIRAIDFHDGFEEPDEAWLAEGWIRSDNRLPNTTWLQVVQDTGDRLHLSRIPASGDGELTVDILPGVTQALVAISPVVPVTSLDTEYTLEANLIDADGAVMNISRACAVTTTHALNFRDGPNGGKIGLVQQGASLSAIKRDDDWIMVDFRGVPGWIHAGYVTQAGDCA